MDSAVENADKNTVNALAFTVFLSFNQYICNSLACKAVAVWVGCFGHFVVFALVLKQGLEVFVDNLFACTNKFKSTRSNALGTFGCVTHNKHGLAERWSFLLDSPAIGKDEI